MRQESLQKFDEPSSQTQVEPHAPNDPGTDHHRRVPRRNRLLHRPSSPPHNTDRAHGLSNESQWIVGAYGLTLAGFLMLSGRAGDPYGQKKLFVFGIVLFTISSLSGGLAPSLITLVIAKKSPGSRSDPVVLSFSESFEC